MLALAAMLLAAASVALLCADLGPLHGAAGTRNWDLAFAASAQKGAG